MIYHRIKRRLGFDTSYGDTHTMPVYEYRVVHTNGDVSTVQAHGYNTNGAFARFYLYHGVGLFWWHFPDAHAADQEIVRVLESIKEIKKEKVGETTFSATVDLADKTTMNTDVTTEVVE